MVLMSWRMGAINSKVYSGLCVCVLRFADKSIAFEQPTYEQSMRCDAVTI